MHPAYSIIIFTTLSGLGYGLAVMLGLGFLDPSAPTTKIAYLAALALISTGLLASLLHLGNPQRAWRALSQWRSSWLSREGVMAIATFVPLTSNAALCLFMNRQDGILGLIDQEHKFFAILERTRAFRLVDGKLTLRDASGKTIARLARQD